LGGSPGITAAAKPEHSSGSALSARWQNRGASVPMGDRGLAYKVHVLNWLACTETIRSTKPEASEEQPKTTSFVHITDLSINARNIADTSKTGQLRWKIENEGFNTVKNGGMAWSINMHKKVKQRLKITSNSCRWHTSSIS